MPCITFVETQIKFLRGCIGITILLVGWPVSQFALMKLYIKSTSGICMQDIFFITITSSLDVQQIFFIGLVSQSAELCALGHTLVLMAIYEGSNHIKMTFLVYLEKNSCFDYNGAGVICPSYCLLHNLCLPNGLLNIDFNCIVFCFWFNGLLHELLLRKAQVCSNLCHFSLIKQRRCVSYVTPLHQSVLFCLYFFPVLM